MFQHPEYGWIGMQAKSRIHGYTGMVTGVQFNLSHATQVAVQRPMDDATGKIPDLILFDAHMVDFSGVPFKDLAIEDFAVECGDQVEDIVTGFQGVCVLIFCGINGCVELVASAPVGEDMKPRSFSQNHKRFKITQKDYIKLADAKSLGEDAGPMGCIGIQTVHKLDV